MLKKHYMEPRKGYILAALLSMTLGLLVTACIIGRNLNIVADAAAAEIYLNASSGSDSNDGTTRSTAVQTFAKAKELVTAGGTIVICSELALTGDIDGAKTTGTRIKLARKGASEATSAAYTAKMLSVASGVTANISNLIVDGGAVWEGTKDETLGRGTTNSGVTATSQLLYTSGTTTVTNCDFQNNYTSSTAGGGVYVGTGTFTMNNGAIKDNSVNVTSSYAAGGGVCVTGGSTFNMSGGTISGNSASYRGGGVYIGVDLYNMQLSYFNMTGGKISGNIVRATGASDSPEGGGVYNTGNFTMENGEISGNSVYSLWAASGGGVSVNFAYSIYGTFNMSGGKISGNSVTSTSNSANISVQGGGLYFYNNCSFSMSGGTISGNSISGTSGSAYVNGGGVYANTVNMSGTVNITGNTKKDDNTANNVYLPRGNITLTGNLSGTGKVGITPYTAPTADAPVDVVAADGTNLTTISAENRAYFTSDNTSYRLMKNSDSTKLQLYALPSPTFTVTIPESVKSSSTTATINLSASLSNFIAGTDNVDVKLTVPTGGLFSLLHPNDSSSVVKYRVKNGSTVFGAGTQTVATFNTTTNSQTLTYEITDTSSAKYAGTYKGTMTYTVAYRES